MFAYGMLSDYKTLSSVVLVCILRYRSVARTRMHLSLCVSLSTGIFRVQGLCFVIHKLWMLAWATQNRLQVMLLLFGLWMSGGLCFSVRQLVWTMVD